MTRVDLPSYSALCWQDWTQIDCDYAIAIPRKFITSYVQSSFPDVTSLVKNFAISEDTQEQIMARVNYDNVTLPVAVCDWLKSSESTWKSWIVISSGKGSNTVVTSSSSASSVNPVPIAIGVAVGGAGLLVLIVLVVLYRLKGKKRRELKTAPGGVVALVFTDIQVVVFSSVS